MVEQLRAEWDANGKPIDQDMRLRFIPKSTLTKKTQSFKSKT